MPRKNARQQNQLREIRVTKDYLKNAQSSCLVEFGNTKVICAVTLEENVPPFLRNSGTGWLTAEYGMLPCSCNVRIQRNKITGRTHEIQRLIGRSLRSVVDLVKIGERTIKVDCDVVQADGGTRTAAITGSFIAVADLLQSVRQQIGLVELPIKDMLAAVSVGMLDKELLLDLDFSEDSKADMDMNVVMRGCGDFIEVQGTAEGLPFSREKLNLALDLAKKGIEELFDIQRESLQGLRI
ncbi:MAG: ribonuclease PH [Candidatus Aceula meridiana]|nr:ribonuclease PH [Candidatus Aceula meridiana]